MILAWANPFNMAISVNYNDHAKSVKTDLNSINLGPASCKT